MVLDACRDEIKARTERLADLVEGKEMIVQSIDDVIASFARLRIPFLELRRLAREGDEIIVAAGLEHAKRLAHVARPVSAGEMFERADISYGIETLVSERNVEYVGGDESDLASEPAGLDLTIILIDNMLDEIYADDAILILGEHEGESSATAPELEHECARCDAGEQFATALGNIAERPDISASFVGNIKIILVRTLFHICIV